MGGTGRQDGGRAGGVPMAERLSAWVGARAAPTPADAARVLEHISGQRPELTTKRSLVALSHAIENAVLAAPPAEPTIVLALFQRMEYFERERATYERIVRTGARVAIGFCDDPVHALPEDVAAVSLDPAEALVNEWSVVAVTPEAGAFLVATDQHTVEPGAPTLEAGRRFRSRWGFSRVQATVELARLRLVLGERLPADMVRTIDRLLGETMASGADRAGSAGTPQEVWSTSAAFHLAERLSSARTGSARLRAQLADAHAVAAARHAAGVDPQSGLTTPEFLHRWSDGDGTTVLPVGVGLFDLSAVAEAGRGGTDPRAAFHAARRIAAAVTQPLGPVDAAVRLSEREFLVVVPGASELHLARICDDILEQLTLASDGYPHVSLAGRLATTVTRGRPLPLRELREGLAGIGDDPGPRTAGTTASGDAIVVCSTGSGDAGDPGSDPAAVTGRPGVGDGTDPQVLGHGRFPRSFPFPGAGAVMASAGPAATIGGASVGEASVEAADAHTPADGIAVDRPDDPDAPDPSVLPSVVPSPGPRSRHELDHAPRDRAARQDDRSGESLDAASSGLSGDSGLSGGSGSDADLGDGVGTRGDGEGRRPQPSPWQARPDDEDGAPAPTAVDEVRNLFGRRN